MVFHTHRLPGSDFIILRRYILHLNSFKCSILFLLVRSNKVVKIGLTFYHIEMKIFGILKSTCLMRMLLRLTGNCVTENGIIRSSNRSPWKKIKHLAVPSP